MSARSSRAPGQRGFTLLEIVVGLLIATMILTGLTAAARTINRGWQNGTGAALRQDMFDRALDVIAGDVARIERIVAPGEKAERYLFHGSATEMSYVLVDRPYPTAAQPYFVRLAVVGEGRSERLMRTRASYNAEAPDLATAPWGDEVILIEGGYSVGFSYRAPRAGIGQWTETWSLPNRMPEEVRIEIRHRHSGEMAIPPVVVALRIRAEPMCANPKASGCTVMTGGDLSVKAE